MLEHSTFQTLSVPEWLQSQHLSLVYVNDVVDVIVSLLKPQPSFEHNMNARTFYSTFQTLSVPEWLQSQHLSLVYVNDVVDVIVSLLKPLAGFQHYISQHSPLMCGVILYVCGRFSTLFLE